MAEKLDPRQILFLKYYLDPKSETFANAYQSAIKAGFSEEYAKTIVSRELDWVSESVRTEEMINKAEKNLKNAMDLPLEDVNLGRMNLEASKFVASRLGKKKWSERTELTGADGKDLPTPIYGGTSTKD